jgi:hypothetical protein
MLQLSFGTVYRLSMVVYDREAGCSVALNLGRYQGLHTDAEAPLWTRRLPPREFLRFSQPRVFVARLVAGLSDIHLHVSSSYWPCSGFRCLLVGNISRLHPPKRSLGHATLPCVSSSFLTIISDSHMLSRLALLPTDLSPVGARILHCERSRSGRGAQI